MKLEMNARGSWATIIEFDEDSLLIVISAAGFLARAAASPDATRKAISFRVTDGGGRSPKVVQYIRA